jgi:hypothetical protein
VNIFHCGINFTGRICHWNYSLLNAIHLLRCGSIARHVGRRGFFWGELPGQRKPKRMLLEPPEKVFVLGFSLVSDKKKTVFREISEVALRLNQEPDDTAEAPTHEFFTDAERNIRTIKCPNADCTALYAIGYSRIYRAKRGISFEDWSDQLLLRLEEDHRANQQHRSVIPLRWSDTTRKREREQKSEETKPNL